MNGEARLGFWALAYLVQLHRSGHPDGARNTADDALADLDAKAADLLPEGHMQEGQNHVQARSSR